jgi:GNAT superfamily N-acetyltransferase
LVVATERIVSRARESDVDDLIELRYRWRTDGASDVAMSAEEYRRRCRVWLDEHHSSHIGYLARVDDLAVGCAWLCVIDRVPGPDKFERRGGILQSVYVEPVSRDVGVGSALISVITTDAHAMGLDYVLVHPSPKSFEFYRRLGFAAAGRALELRFDP